jgi:hypothetical protein
MKRRVPLLSEGSNMASSSQSQSTMQQEEEREQCPVINLNLKLLIAEFLADLYLICQIFIRNLAPQDQTYLLF